MYHYWLLNRWVFPRDFQSRIGIISNNIWQPIRVRPRDTFLTLDFSSGMATIGFVNDIGLPVVVRLFKGIEIHGNKAVYDIKPWLFSVEYPTNRLWSNKDVVYLRRIFCLALSVRMDWILIRCKRDSTGRKNTTGPLSYVEYFEMDRAISWRKNVTTF